MLEALRHATRSWFFRGFLILLASTFALYFGSGGSIFSGLSNRPVAEVGRVDISQAQFVDEYFRTYQSVSRDLSPDQARAFGLPLSTLRTLVGGALLDNAARKYGIAVSDGVLASAIRADVGNLSPAMYESVLRQQGLRIETYEGRLREELVRMQIVTTVAPLPPAPRVLAEALYRYREEQRVLEVVAIPETVAGETAPPDESVLVEYHSNHTTRYTTPEMREVTAISMLPDDLIESVRVAEEEIADEYELRLRSYTTPDLREVAQLFFESEDAARAARARIDGGVAFADAALTPADIAAAAEADDLAAAVALAEAEAAAAAEPPAGLAPDAVADAAVDAPADAAAEADPPPDPEAQARARREAEAKLGLVAREELPDGVADAVFALEEGAVSQPLRSAFGWHLYRMDTVQQGSVRSLEEVHDELREILAREKAIGELNDLSIQLDDSLAAGDTLEEAAARMGLVLVHVTVDRRGSNLDDEPHPDLPPFSQFVDIAFRTNEGRESRLIDAPEGGYFVLRVDAVVPPAVRPFENIVERVREDWTGEERARLAREYADAFLERAELRGDLAAEALAAELEVTPAAPFNRIGSGLDLNLSRQLVSAAFGLSVGEFTSALAPDGGMHVVRLAEIRPIDVAEHADELEQMRRELSGDLSTDLLAQYEDALEAAYSIRLDERAFEQALSNVTQTLPVRAN